MPASYFALPYIQVAVYQTLSRDPSMVSLAPGGVWDGSLPPTVKEPTFPYIVLDSWIENTDDRLNTIGRDLTFVLHVWSDQYGYKESSGVVDQVLFLLNRRHIAADPWNITDISLVQVLTVPQLDELRHITVRMRVKCQPIPY